MTLYACCILVESDDGGFTPDMYSPELFTENKDKIAKWYRAKKKVLLDKLVKDYNPNFPKQIIYSRENIDTVGRNRWVNDRLAELYIKKIELDKVCEEWSSNDDGKLTIKEFIYDKFTQEKADDIYLITDMEYGKYLYDRVEFLKDVKKNEEYFNNS